MAEMVFAGWIGALVLAVASDQRRELIGLAFALLPIAVFIGAIVEFVVSD